jgi:hypothetical protein
MFDRHRQSNIFPVCAMLSKTFELWHLGMNEYWLVLSKILWKEYEASNGEEKQDIQKARLYISKPEYNHSDELCCITFSQNSYSLECEKLSKVKIMWRKTHLSQVWLHGILRHVFSLDNNWHTRSNWSAQQGAEACQILQLPLKQPRRLV